MDRLAPFALIALLCLNGCGSSNQPVAENQNTESQSASPASALTVASATDVVSQFLDEIRRGGQDSRAHQLLTQKAQSELQRIGRSVQPIGSPDARFQVTRAEAVPDEENSALVHSVWSEPNGDGNTADYQVVWAVEQESGSWRISGLVMEVDPSQPPVIIDFENGEMMARLFSGPKFESSNAASAVPNLAPTSGAAPSQAAIADPNLAR